MQRVDQRIKPFLEGWSAVEKYKGHDINIPGTWDSEIYPYKYFQVIKQPNEANFSEDENEIQCYLSVGWRGFDDEIIIILGIFGKDVLSGRNKISAEIMRSAGADIKLYYKGKLVTDFTERAFILPRKVGKVYFPDIVTLLPQR